MALSLTLSKLSYARRREILRDFTVRSKETIYEPNPPPIRCFKADLISDTLYLPIGSWRELKMNRPPNDTSNFPKIKDTTIFNGKLFNKSTDLKKRDQNVVAAQSLDRLEKEGSIFISCFTGYGKCLAPGTEVLMFNGSKKVVEKLKIGDQLMGDDSSPRTILTLCQGTEEMYEVVPNIGEPFTVNGSHILSLKIVGQGSIKEQDNNYILQYFHRKSKIIETKTFLKLTDALALSKKYSLHNKIDISVNDYNRLDDRCKRMLKAYWVSVKYPAQEVLVEPFQAGYLLGLGDPEMIKYLEHHGGRSLYRFNSKIVRDKFFEGLCSGCGTSRKYDLGTRFEYNVITHLSESFIMEIRDLCRSLGRICFVKTDICKNNGITVPLYYLFFSRELPDKDLITDFTLYPKGVGFYNGFTIDGNGRFLLGTHMVTHNTTIGVYLSLKLRLKTMVLCHLEIVRKQWVEEYKKLGDNVTIQYLEGQRCQLDPDADVYVAGIQKAGSMSVNDFASIGTVIIDETHLSTVTAFTKTLLNFQPRYLIGLSATPDRPDGLQSLLTKYFGETTDFIVRKEKKSFTVYKVQTKFKPEISYMIVRGQMVRDWNAIISSIEKNNDRWRLIIEIVKKHPEKKIIILCNRNVLSIGLYELLKKEKEDVELLIGSAKRYDRSKRVLVVGFKKGGVGLNDPNLTMAIIASDTKDVRQYEGRIRTTNNLIYHLVDDDRSFQRHWEECEKWYREKGAVIKVV